MTGELVQPPLDGDIGAVRALAFSSDGAKLASGSDDGTLRLWDIVNGTSSPIAGHTDCVVSVAFSPVGN
jgi:WD40 repeat protein